MLHCPALSDFAHPYASVLQLQNSCFKLVEGQLILEKAFCASTSQEVCKSAFQAFVIIGNQQSHHLPIDLNQAVRLLFNAQISCITVSRPMLEPLPGTLARLDIPEKVLLKN